MLVIILGTIFIVYAKEESISLVKDEVTIEYGNTYIPDIQELIELNKYKFINLNEIRIESDIQNENDKDYPAVGEYEVNVYYKNSNLKQKVKVIDTVAPELSIQENIELEYNTDLSTIDFGEYIEIRDLSEQKDYIIDFSKVDSKLSGEYEAIVSIEDIYGNKAQKNFKITILEKKEEIQQEMEEQTTSTNEQVQPSGNNKTNKNSKTTTSNNTKENSNSNTTIETQKKESNSPNTSATASNQNTNKINLSKYSYYEKGANGTYKGFMEDTSEINTLRTLIDNAVKKFGYKNVTVKQDSSLARNGTRYFTANSVNVENEVYDSEGFTICYYAVKEYLISSDGTEKFFQNRSYIKVK